MDKHQLSWRLAIDDSHVALIFFFFRHQHDKSLRFHLKFVKKNNLEKIKSFVSEIHSHL